MSDAMSGPAPTELHATHATPLCQASHLGRAIKGSRPGTRKAPAVAASRFHGLLSSAFPRSRRRWRVAFCRIRSRRSRTAGGRHHRHRTGHCRTGRKIGRRKRPRGRKARQRDRAIFALRSILQRNGAELRGNPAITLQALAQQAAVVTRTGSAPVWKPRFLWKPIRTNGRRVSRLLFSRRESRRCLRNGWRWCLLDRLARWYRPGSDNRSDQIGAFFQYVNIRRVDIRGPGRENLYNANDRSLACGWAQPRPNASASSLQPKAVFVNHFPCLHTARPRHVSKHSLVKAESGCSREPTGGASPVLARQHAPSGSRTAMTAPLADIAERICSTVVARRADIR